MQAKPTAAGVPAHSHRRPTWTALLPALATVLLLAAAAGDAQAQWRWRDKSGHVTASDRPPPPDVAERDILSRPTAQSAGRNATPPAAAGSAASGVAGLAQKGPLDVELDARKRAAEQEQAAKTRADEARLAAQRAENCRRARSHVATLDTGQRIARVNERGEREVIDDRARADELRQAREVIASDCR